MLEICYLGGFRGSIGLSDARKSRAGEDFFGFPGGREHGCFDPFLAGNFLDSPSSKNTQGGREGVRFGG